MTFSAQVVEMGCKERKIPQMGNQTGKGLGVQVSKVLHLAFGIEMASKGESVTIWRHTIGTFPWWVRFFGSLRPSTANYNFILANFTFV
jgi:hypothetical protein